MAKPHTTKPWTSREEKGLLRLVDLGHSDPEIAIKLGRTSNSVGCKRQRLGRYRHRRRDQPIHLVNALDRWIALPWLEARITSGNAPRY
jgi:hypothetical protein